MYCRQCGHRVEEGKRFCTQCGAAVTAKQTQPEKPVNDSNRLKTNKQRSVKSFKHRRELWIALAAAAVAAVVLALLGVFGVLSGGGSEAPVLAYEPLISISDDGHFSVQALDGITTESEDTKYYMDGKLYKDMRTKDFMDKPHTLEALVYDEFGRELGIVKFEGLMIIDTSEDDSVNMGDYVQAQYLSVYDPAGKLDLEDLAGAKNVRTLTLRKCAGIENMDGIDQFAKLYSLILTVTDIHDLDGLKKAKGLRALHICETQVDTFAFLEDMQSLESLTLFFTSISDYDVLEDMKALKTLRIGYIEADSTQPLGKLTALESLTLAGFFGGDIDVVGRLTSLRELTLLNVSCEDLDVLEDLKRLEYLALNATKLSDIGGIRNLDQLKELKLSGAKISDLDDLGRLNRLETLALLDMTLQNADALTHLEQLKTLSLGDVTIENDDVLAVLEDDMGVKVRARKLTVLAMDAQQTPQPTAAPTPEPTPEPTPAPTPEPTPEAGNSITLEYIPAQALPDIEHPGAVPDMPYTIAISNGDMANEWRRTFWADLSATGEMYTERFGIKVIEANSGSDSTKQVQDAQTLLAKQPDLLLLSPNEAAPLAVVGDMCEEAGIPYITLDRTVTRTPGQGMYVCAIMIDGYQQGVRNGVRIVDDMIRKNGEPRGKYRRDLWTRSAQMFRSTEAPVCGVCWPTIRTSRS